MFQLLPQRLRNQSLLQTAAALTPEVPEGSRASASGPATRTPPTPGAALLPRARAPRQVRSGAVCALLLPAGPAARSFPPGTCCRSPGRPVPHAGPLTRLPCGRQAAWAGPCPDDVPQEPGR